MNIKTMLAIAVLLVIVSGCSRTIVVDYVTIPRGATIYSGDKVKGVSPLRLSYSLSPKENRRTHFSTKTLKAQWKSGVTETFNEKIAIPRNGRYVEMIIERPRESGGAASRQEDYDYALMLDKNDLLKQQQQQAQAAQRARVVSRNNDELIDSLFPKADKALQRQQQLDFKRQLEDSYRAKTKCTSIINGRRVDTVCR